jgi:hypothetical protein
MWSICFENSKPRLAYKQSANQQACSVNSISFSRSKSDSIKQHLLQFKIIKCFFQANTFAVFNKIHWKHTKPNFEQQFKKVWQNTNRFFNWILSFKMIIKIRRTIWTKFPGALTLGFNKPARRDRLCIAEVRVKAASQETRPVWRHWLSRSSRLEPELSESWPTSGSPGTSRP